MIYDDRRPHATPSHIITARELAKILGVSELDLHRLAHARSLPIFCGQSGWAISRDALEMWKRAALIAAGERENAA